MEDGPGVCTANESGKKSYKFYHTLSDKEKDLFVQFTKNAKLGPSVSKEIDVPLRTLRAWRQKFSNGGNVRKPSKKDKLHHSPLAVQFAVPPTPDVPSTVTALSRKLDKIAEDLKECAQLVRNVKSEKVLTDTIHSPPKDNVSFAVDPSSPIDLTENYQTDEAINDMNTLDCDITVVSEIVVTKMLFKTVNLNWQRDKCKMLGLEFIMEVVKPYDTLNIEVPLTAEPAKIIQIIGDGNCMFRSLAFCISGNQEDHELVRSKIVEFEKMHPNKTFQGSLNASRRTSLEKMKNLAEWGTDLELIAAATLLNTVIYTYSASGQIDGKKVWTRFNPSDIPKESWCEGCIYLDHHNGNHYNVVLSIDCDEQKNEFKANEEPDHDACDQTPHTALSYIQPTGSQHVLQELSAAKKIIEPELQPELVSGKWKIREILNSHLKLRNLVLTGPTGSYHYLLSKTKRTRTGQIQYFHCVCCSSIRRTSVSKSVLVGSIRREGCIYTLGCQHNSKCLPVTDVKTLALEIKRKAKKRIVKREMTAKTAFRDAVIKARTLSKEKGLEVRGPNSISAELGIYPESCAAFRRFEKVQYDGEKADIISDGFGDLGNYINDTLGDRWVLDQSKAKGVIILVNDYGLQLLSKAKKLQADGTFRVAPRGFSQYLTIFAKVENLRWVPIVGVIMKNRSTDSYEYVFNVLEQASMKVMADMDLPVTKLPVEVFITDYEPSLQNAVVKAFGAHVLVGCLFHYTKAVLRYCGSHQLDPYYQDERSTIHKWIRRLLALPLIPQGWIMPLWNSRLRHPPQAPPNCHVWPDAQLQVIVQYMTDQWLDLITGIGNHYGSVEDRTTNAAEGYHGSLQNMSTHPGLARFLEQLREDLVLQEQKVTVLQKRIEDNWKVPYKRDKRYINTDRSLAKSFLKVQEDITRILHVHDEDIFRATDDICLALESNLECMAYQLEHIWHDDRTLTVTRKEGLKRARQSGKLPCTENDAPKKKLKRLQCKQPVQKGYLSRSVVSTVRGLVNGNNICYANSVLQAFGSIPLLRNILKQHSASANDCIEDHKSPTFRDYCMACVLRDDLDKLLSKNLTNNLKASIANQFVEDILYDEQQIYVKGRQQDAQEFMNAVIDRLEGMDAKQPFIGDFVSTVECSQCNYISRKVDEFTMWQLSLPTDESQTSVDASLRHMATTEVLQDFKCDNCYCRNQAIRKTRFNKLGNILILHVSRFAYNSKGLKLKNSLKFENILHLVPLMNNSESATFKLSAVVCHEGSNMDSGHYYTYAEHNGLWLNCNDTVVNVIDGIYKVLQETTNVYLLIYTRGNFNV